MENMHPKHTACQTNRFHIYGQALWLKRWLGRVHSAARMRKMKGVGVSAGSWAEALAWACALSGENAQDEGRGSERRLLG